MLLISQVMKYIVKYYWSADLKITTPALSQTISQNCSEAIWQAWHFTGYSQLKGDSSRLFKVNHL